MKTPVNLLDLGDDILYLIFKQINDYRGVERCLISLTEVSRQCYRIAFPILWHSVRFHDWLYDEKQQENMKQVLIDEKHSASNYVRSFYMQSVKGIDPLILEKMIDGMSMLRTFHWESPQKISENVLSKLEQRWPGVSLHVVNNNGVLIEDSPSSMNSTSANIDTRDLGKLTAITDRRLLSSSSLCSLDCKIHWIWEGGYPFSELNTVCDLLARSPNLENLKIGFHKWKTGEDRQRILASELMSMRVNVRDSHGLPPMFSRPDFQLPQLTALRTPLRDDFKTICSFPYKLLTLALLSHLSEWKTPVKTLELEQVSHRLPFDQLAGRTPNLRDLDIMLDASEDEVLEEDSLEDNFSENFDNYYPAIRFIASCSSIQNLNIQNKTTKIEDVWPAVLKHKHSLRQLHLCTDVKYAQIPENYEYERFPHPLLNAQEFASLKLFPLLSEVEIDISLADAEAFISFGTGTGGDPETLTQRGQTLIQMGNVENITLNIEIPAEECAFTDALIWHSQMRPIRKSAMGAAVVGLFDQILAQDPTCRTRLIRFDFNNFGIDGCTYGETIFTASVIAKRMDEITMKRISSDNNSEYNATRIGIVTGVMFHTPLNSPYSTWQFCD